MAPCDRPTLEFEGNSAHSTGYWWGLGTALYVGGTLKFANSTSSVLVYNPGRSFSDVHRTCSATSCSKIGYLRLANSKIFLTNVGISHWGLRVELLGVEVHDTQRSVQVYNCQVFGEAWLTNMLCICRTRNIPVRPCTVACKYYELWFFQSEFTGFTWYDAGQRHIMTNTTFRNCDGTRTPLCTSNCLKSAVWNLITHSNQLVPEVQLVACITSLITSSSCKPRVGLCTKTAAARA